MEYLEGEVDLEMSGENLEIGGSIYDSLGNVLLRGIIGNAHLQGRDMSPHVFDGEET